MYAFNPLENAEFAVACKLQDEPAFAWWVYNVSFLFDIKLD